MNSTPVRCDMCERRNRILMRIPHATSGEKIFEIGAGWILRKKDSKAFCASHRRFAFYKPKEKE